MCVRTQSSCTQFMVDLGKKNISFIIIIVLVKTGILSQACHAQNNNEVFSKLSVEQGLSSVTVTSILKDSRGYLWAGTEDGLNRYNGYEFKIYRNNPSDSVSLLRNRILSLYEDSNNTLWVSFGGGGLQYYDRKLDAFKRVPGCDTTIIKSIKEDGQKRLWIAGTAVRSLDLKTNKWKDHSHLFPEKEQIVAIEQARTDEYWVTSEQSLYKWNAVTGQVKAYRHDPNDENSLSCNSIYTSLMDGKGNLWIATRGGGLDKYEAATNSFLHFRQSERKENGPLVNVIRSLCLDGDYLWLGTENGGLSRLNTTTNKFTHYTSDKNFPRGLNDNSIWSLYKDEAGSLWIGTFSFGICVIDPYKDKFSTLRIPLKNNIVNGIFEDSRKRLWLGTEGGVVLVENDDVSYYLSEPTKKSQNGIPVLTIFEDLQSRIWIGTWSDGVFFFNEEKRRFEQFATVGASKQDLSNEHVYTIHQDSRDQSLLIGSFLGLNVLADPDKKDIFKVIDSTKSIIAPHNNLKTILEDRQSDIWVGTCNGLKLYSREKRELVSLFSEGDKSKNDLQSIVFCLFEDSNGNLWAGAESGLYQIQSTSQFKRYTVADGLSNHSIMAILEDDKGQLWLSTGNGLSVFKPESQTFRNYDASDGLFVNGFKANSRLKGEDGMFYFGGSDGVISFDPSRIEDNPNPPMIALEGIRIYNAPLKINGEDSILRQHISETKEITLSYDANIISIDFVALNFSASNKNQYAYRLKGFDQNWNYVGSSRSATYTNLDPGHYVFEVKAANNDGAWSKEPAQLAIFIQPPWWKTPLAYAVYVIAVLGLFYLFRKLVLMREQYINDIKLERIRSENIERLNQAKLQFFTNISHEFRTPLTLILGPLQNLLDSTAIDEAVHSKLLTVKLNVNRLHRLVNQLLDFRKAESGNMKIVAMEADMVSFIREIKLSFNHLAEEMNINFQFRHPDREMMAWFDHDQLEKVIFNLLSNAFKNTGDGGKIAIDLSEDKEHIRIVVEDTGKGIKASHLGNIFQAFFSYEKGRLPTGTGIGLALSKSLVELHHGSIVAESEEGQYSKFTITLLRGNSHFKLTEIAPSFLECDGSFKLNEVLFGSMGRPRTGEARSGDLCGDLSSDWKAHTVLVVDDNKEVGAFLASILQPEYNVRLASDGKEALKMTEKYMPDLILSDVMMPEMDGIRLCRQLKENSKTSNIPLIFLTARTSSGYQLEGLEHGASDYITKPFDSRVLLLKIKNALHASKQGVPAFPENKYADIEPSHVKLSTKDELFIQAALKSIEGNMENTEYSVNDLCMDVGMSKATLFRKLKALTGKSANEFIRTIRLKRAAQLFSQNGFSVSEVAYKVGFNDPKYFRICFKKLFKVSPSQYAEREKTESR